jgi:hypothetical protein
MIGRGPFEKKLVWVNDEWIIDIPSYFLMASQAKSLNESTAATARREFYGGERDEIIRVSPVTAIVGSNDTIADPYDGAGLIGISDQQRMDNEMLIFQLHNGINPPDDPVLPPLLRV